MPLPFNVFLNEPEFREKTMSIKQPSDCAYGKQWSLLNIFLPPYTLQVMRKTLPTTFNTFIIKAAIRTLLVAAASTFAQAQPCACDHIIDPPSDPSTSVFVDGEILGVKPGQTLCLKAGFYRQIRFVNISGEPGKPVTIKNYEGLVEIGNETIQGRWYAVDIVACKFIRLTGTGDAAYLYGIKLGKSGDSGLKIGGLSTDTEIDHIEIANTGFAGILAKTDFGGSPPAGAPEMNNVNIHDTYIHDTRGEGMYIGETKTPGQDFRHLHIWNNIVTRTGFELIQVANAIEDVQVHNNVFYMGGTRNVLYQNKGVQIGDNSVGRYYNNILMGSPSNSMIIMSSGNVDVFNNYLADAGSPGFFIDNRSVTIPGAPINIFENYILEVDENFPFFSVFNEKNPINIIRNKLEGNNTILGLGSDAGPLVTEIGNTRKVIERIRFMDLENDDFRLAPGCAYQGIGLLEDVRHLNKRPFITAINDQELAYDSQRQVYVSARDPDGDEMTLEAFNLPPFVCFRDKGNGKGVFTLAPGERDTGVYYKVRVRVTDRRGGMDTRYFTITVLDPYALMVATDSSHEKIAANTKNERVTAGPENTKAGDLPVYEITQDPAKGVVLYPNPAVDKVMLDLGSDHFAPVTIEISDQADKSLYRKNWEGETQFIDLDIPIPEMPSGIYLVKIKQKGHPLKILRLIKI